MTNTNFHQFDREFASAYFALKAVPKVGGRGLGYVVHFAAGTGVWLSAADRLGADRLMGLEAQKPSDAPLCVPPSAMAQIDLSKVRVDLPQPADLVICVDYAHTLDSHRADDFISDLCKSGHRVLFGAALPFEHRGLGFHLQWPSFWAKRFAGHGFHPDLRFRERIWANAAIEPSIRQSCMLYVKRGDAYRLRYPLENLDVVHPSFFLDFNKRQDWLAKQLTKTTISRLNRKASK